MLACLYCKRAFYEGEVISIRVIRHTEHPHHFECLEKTLREEWLLSEIFGESDTIENYVFTRTFWRAQVETTARAAASGDAGKGEMGCARGKTGPPK